MIVSNFEEVCSWEAKFDPGFHWHGDTGDCFPFPNTFYKKGFGLDNINPRSGISIKSIFSDLEGMPGFIRDSIEFETSSFCAGSAVFDADFLIPRALPQYLKIGAFIQQEARG